MQIVKPNIKEQKGISNIFALLDSNAALAFNQKSKLLDLFTAWLNKLMTGQICVKDIEFKLEEMKI